MASERVNDSEGAPGSSNPTGAACEPFGNPAEARVFVIGHDPRLQRSDAEAATVFFLDYLERAKPGSRSEAAKYELARATVDYIQHLTGGRVPLSQMYFTNLCNEFLPHAPKRSTVLIPDVVADRGIDAIHKALDQGKPQVMIPMSAQVFYHLGRSGFVSNQQAELERFIRAAAAHPERAAEGAYRAVGRRPFLDVCGKLFSHRELAVVPVLHVKQWPLGKRILAYESAMQAAVENIHACLGKPPSPAP